MNQTGWESDPVGQTTCAVSVVGVCESFSESLGEQKVQSEAVEVVHVQEERQTLPSLSC